MKNIFIPSIGTVLRLEADWWLEINLYRRNYSLIEKIEQIKINDILHPFTSEMLAKYSFLLQYPKSITIPKATHLRVEYISIRKGYSEYDFIRLKVIKNSNLDTLKLKGAKFEVLLKDANNIVCSVIEKNE